MKQFILILIILFSLSSPAFSGWEYYVIEREDGGVSIMSYNEESGDSLDQAIADWESGGFKKKSVKKASDVTFPSDKKDREFWELKSNKVQLNTAKKNSKDAEKALKKSKLDGLKSRLGLDDEDLELIRKGV